jgi:hypothetical protein
MPLTARRHVQKMRGGAQAHLIQAEDGHHYVVKFRNNPQHPRVLVNEWISAALLGYLQIASPEVAVIDVPAEFIAANPNLCLEVGGRRLAVEAGWQFGSRYPGDPALVAVYDYVPDALLNEVTNIRQFPGMLAFDKWVGNADGRQAVFFRGRVKSWSPRRQAQRAAFVAWMIDHGFAFNGPHWDFPDAPLQGVYHRPIVYETVRSLDDFQPWLDQVVHFPEEVVDQALRQVPLAWVAGPEEALLEELLERLMERRARVPDLLVACRRARPALFPNWT